MFFMKSTWTGILICGLVIYFGVVHSAGNPAILLNSHALILVLGGTIGIAYLTYSAKRLNQVYNYIVFGFLFKTKKNESSVIHDIFAMIDAYYELVPRFSPTGDLFPFLKDAMNLLENPEYDATTLQEILVDRRNSVKRLYLEDAKILNNIAKYPPHLGLLGAASGMIGMMSGLGKVGIESIGASMAVALTATLWGVGLNNFVFLPLADNSTKAAEDDLFLRDIIIETCIQMKKGYSHKKVITNCRNKLSMMDHYEVSRILSSSNGQTKNAS
jgi:chemotaxis protein MotA